MFQRKYLTNQYFKASTFSIIVLLYFVILSKYIFDNFLHIPFIISLFCDKFGIVEGNYLYLF